MKSFKKQFKRKTNYCSLTYLVENNVTHHVQDLVWFYNYSFIIERIKRETIHKIKGDCCVS